MKLDKKKDLAARTLGVGRKRVIFNKERLDEIKESITRQDIRELVNDKAISISEIKGKKKIVKRKTRRRAGSVKKTVNKSKRDYMTITRKLRAYVKELRKHGAVDSEQYWKLRKEIRAKEYKSKANLKDKIATIAKETK
jgi:large subunit ribosomal protein L19e